ncbi:class I SAM-dependent methyltransferase [Spongiibacter sp. KMU-166]|uniref:Class I SAM-dependent methyltransferase n=1 Tax=Spongiibacter thalassae TaxID=2721624 RepID=A0ABX1GGA5_9GAMM|nr:class I SAM-dependent methyltransferase [Spongiibacter thalassae]NKI18235.1 class I SAM-dependent methyltransferase [Spongiibacter thalassae]
MSLYENYILPHVINCACSMPAVMAVREEIVPLASGVVLEVGMGSGLNLPLYTAENIDFIWGLEPSDAMRRRAADKLAASPLEVRWLELGGEAIPLEDNSVDTVLLTFTLCTIPDWRAALAHIRRVLKPAGTLLFCEHGLSRDAEVQHWQQRLTPVWKRLAGGCHLDRPIAQMLRESGFAIDDIQTRYLPKTPRVAGYVYSGSATKG